MIIKRHQTFLDFVTQHAGGIEALFEVAGKNGIGITDDVAPGTELGCTPTNLLVVNTYLRGDFEVSANFDLDGETPTGIDYMQIGNDFIVR